VLASSLSQETQESLYFISWIQPWAAAPHTIYFDNKPTIVKHTEKKNKKKINYYHMWQQSFIMQ